MPCKKNPYPLSLAWTIRNNPVFSLPIFIALAGIGSAGTYLLVKKISKNRKIKEAEEANKRAEDLIRMAAQALAEKSMSTDALQEFNTKIETAKIETQGAAATGDTKKLDEIKTNVEKVTDILVGVFDKSISLWPRLIEDANEAEATIATGAGKPEYKDIVITIGEEGSIETNEAINSSVTINTRSIEPNADILVGSFNLLQEFIALELDVYLSVLYSSGLGLRVKFILKQHSTPTEIEKEVEKQIIELTGQLAMFTERNYIPNTFISYDISLINDKIVDYVDLPGYLDYIPTWLV